MGAAETMHEAWKDLIKSLSDSSEMIFKNPMISQNPQDLATAARYISYMLRFGSEVLLEVGDADYPELRRLWGPYNSWGMDATDVVTHYAAVRPDATYRIHGKRGTARIFDIQTNSGNVTDMPDTTIHDKVAFAIDPDHDDIEIFISSTAHAANWVPLRPDTGWILIRQYAADWLNEQVADLCIERVDAQYPQPSPDPALIEDRVRQLSRWMREGGIPVNQAMADPSWQVPEGEIAFSIFARGMGAEARYGRGNFHCEPGEAVILEAECPAAAYWSFQLLSYRWESMEFQFHQTSINDFQARVDEDGIFRAVICQTDPGVENWLDPCGRKKSLICARFIRPESDPKATLRKVPLTELRQYLPQSTPIFSNQERQQQLRDRMIGVFRRFRE